MSPYAAFGAPLAPYNSVPMGTLSYVAALQQALQSAAASAQISSLTSLSQQTEVGNTPSNCTASIIPASNSSSHHASPYSIEGLLYNNNKGDLAIEIISY